MPGALVRVQATDHAVTADEGGRFTLPDLASGEPVTLTAWAPGYFIAALENVVPGSGIVEIELAAHNDLDHPEYEWVSAFSAAGDEANCENCHSDPSGLLPFDEWFADAHAHTLENPRFLTMYAGTDVDGNRSPPTRYVTQRDYGRVQLPPHPSKPYFGPGYKLDFPESQGNCSTCHAPAAAINAAYQTNPLSVSGVGDGGITCDFCHKIWDVWLDPGSELPQVNMPGVLSYEFRRPDEGHQFFAGPFDDVAPGEDTYTPIQTESVYCAPCHFGVFWDTTIYNSYGEWLDSSYSDLSSGRTCQDCHMPPSGTTVFARPDKGGLERDPSRIASHRMLGVTDDPFMRGAADLQAEARLEEDEIVVDVRLTNDNTGHKLPTDSPLRNVMLLVRAFDDDGVPLKLLEGPELPAWTGANFPLEGHYSGLPGKGFALILEEQWTGISPSGAYWNPVRVVSDTRLEPFQTDESHYRFESPVAGAATIEVQLIFRRAFIELMEQKGWTDPDLIMTEKVIELNH